MNNNYKCSSCGLEGFDNIVRFVTTLAGEEFYYCRDCRSGKSVGVKDVWYGYGSGTHTEENICDPETGKPIPFSSRQGKWEAMQKAGVVEAGDKFHGARTTYKEKKRYG